MPDPLPIEPDWDFYLCRIDDRPASVFTDLANPRRGADPELDTLYAVLLAMGEPGEHGMGTADEAEVLFPVEDAVRDAAEESGFRYVGRIRGSDRWQLCFMAAAGREPELDLLVHPAASAAPRSAEIRSMHDPDWSYVLGFLHPEAERLQWIMDRRVVEALAREGDPLTTAREVRHWIGFSALDASRRCSEQLTEQGFTCEEPQRDEGGNWSLLAHRKDPVDLQSIHEVVMLVIGAAEPFGGDYDGWETQVQ